MVLKCIVCGRDMVEVEYIDDDPTQCWWEGIVERVTAGYGSCHDTDCFLVCVCDSCLTAKRADGSIKVQANPY